MTKGNALQDKLARSLDKANRKTAAKPAKAKARKATSSEAIEIPAKTVFKKRKRLPVEGCSKLSVSLFPTDMERLKAIRVYMAGQGEIISTSQAVKLALRAAPVDAGLVGLLEDIRNEDGR